MSRFLDLKSFSPLHLVISWYLTLVFSFFFCILLFLHSTIILTKPTPIQFKYQLYKSLPTNASLDSIPHVTITKQDARALLIKKFFAEYDSPLKNQADKFLEVADKYKLDYRLLPAIAMQESSGGKRLPEGSFNPFGYGIYGDNIRGFSSFNEAIEVVGQGIKKNYIEQGLTTPDTIMPKYTPPSVEKGGPWAIGVSGFMEEMR